MQRGGMIYLKYLNISDLRDLMSVQLLAVCACIRFATSQTQVMSGRFSGSGLMHILTNCRSQERKITCKKANNPAKQYLRILKFKLKRLATISPAQQLCINTHSAFSLYTYCTQFYASRYAKLNFFFFNILYYCQKKI